MIDGTWHGTSAGILKTVPSTYSGCRQGCQRTSGYLTWRRQRTSGIFVAIRGEERVGRMEHSPTLDVIRKRNNQD
jgi:hypothetical protein